MTVLVLEHNGCAQRYQLRQCEACNAPLVSPFPDDMTVDLVKEGPECGPVASFVTPHMPDCWAPLAGPEPGHAIRVPGSMLSMDVSVPLPHVFRPFVAGSPSGTVISDWCGHGAVEAMTSDRGFCGRPAGDLVHTPWILAYDETTEPIEMVLPDGSRSARVVPDMKLRPVGLPRDRCAVVEVLEQLPGGAFRHIVRASMLDGDTLTVDTSVDGDAFTVDSSKRGGDG